MPTAVTASAAQPPNSSGSRHKLVIGLLLVILVGCLLAVTWKGDWLDELVARQAQLDQAYQQYPWLVLLLAGVFYAVVTGLSIPGATILSLIYAWQFGFWVALPLISVASTCGATLAFWSSRYLLRDLVRQRLGDRLPAVQASLDRDGPSYLFFMRLVPAFPFFVVNALMGLTTMRTWTYWWVSQLGMLPGTAIYIFAGSRIPDLETLQQEGIAAVFSPSQIWQLFLALALIGCFPWLARRWARWLRRPDSDPAAEETKGAS